MRIAISTLMHGRHETCDFCLDYNLIAGIDLFMYSFTISQDREWCARRGVNSVFAANDIPKKAQVSLSHLANYSDQFDAVLLVGSDDYVDPAFIALVSEKLKDHDYISFSDMRFRQGNDWWVWPGYPKGHHREGEPAGAGKVVRKDLLDKIRYRVFSGNTGGTDKNAHDALMRSATNPVILSAEKEGVLLVDVKDKASRTPIAKFDYLRRIG